MGNNPLFIIRAYGELFSRIELSDEERPGQLYAVNIKEFFLFICFWAPREMVR